MEIVMRCWNDGIGGSTVFITTVAIAMTVAIKTVAITTVIIATTLSPGAAIDVVPSFDVAVR